MSSTIGCWLPASTSFGFFTLKKWYLEYSGALLDRKLSTAAEPGVIATFWRGGRGRKLVCNADHCPPLFVVVEEVVLGVQRRLAGQEVVYGGRAGRHRHFLEGRERTKTRMQCRSLFFVVVVFL